MSRRQRIAHRAHTLTRLLTAAVARYPRGVWLPCEATEDNPRGRQLRAYTDDELGAKGPPESLAPVDAAWEVLWTHAAAEGRRGGYLIGRARRDAVAGRRPFGQRHAKTELEE